MKKEKMFIFIILIASLFLSIGFAVVNNTTLLIAGIAVSADNGVVKITNVTLSTYNKLNTNSSSVTFDDDSVHFNLVFNVTNNDLQNNAEFYATYLVTMYNDTISDYVFASHSFTPDLSTSANENMTVQPELIGVTYGEIIPAKTQKQFYVRINVYPEKQGTYTVNGDSNINTNIDNDGTLIGTFTGSTTSNLRSPNEIAHFTVSVANTYKTPKTFSFEINNNNFKLTDANGNNIGNFIINEEDTSTFDLYIKVADNAVFAVDTIKLNVNLKPIDADSSSVGIITLLVDQDVTLSDDVPPTISDVVGTLQPTIGTVLVTWDGDDNVGIDHYKVEAFIEGNSTASKTALTDADEEELAITGLSDGNYYFKVTAYDQVNNSASAQSSVESYIWHFTVTYSLTNAASTGSNSDIINYGDDYEVTLSGTGDYNMPATVTIAMVGNDEPTYSYSSSSGVLKIQNVTGNVTITAEGRTNGCLIKGTKILLANGSYKNIEDITYSDLLAVWSHDTGSLTYEYPLLIKNTKEVKTYYRITFSDKSYIDIFDDHGFYSTDYNIYVAFKDKKRFGIGSNIAKVNNDGTLTSVKVTNIEEITEDTNYYFIASTRYFNIIANDLITSYQETYISNLYRFGKNAKWSFLRNIILLNKNNIYNYDYFSDVLPYYMYTGFRAGEAGFLINYNIVTLDKFKKFISTELMGEGIVKTPINVNNERYWMVTTSLDNINDYNKNNYLVKEGTTYTLPRINDIKKYYSTSENKYYNPGDKIKINYSMHFIAIK